MPETDPQDFRPPSSRPAPASPLRWVVAGVAGAMAVAGAAWWMGWLPPPTQMPAPIPPASVASVASGAQGAAPAPPPGAAASGPEHPVEPEGAAAPATVAEADAAIARSLGEWLGGERVAAMLRMDEVVRRIVVTVDNLPRAQAPAGLWPVQPAPQRFLVQAVPGSAATENGAPLHATVAPANAARYAALVALAEAVPREQAVALYRQLYPLFQQTYVELGYPKGYFNDRLVAVLGHLLQTPEVHGPLNVQLTRVQGEVPSTRPWVRYEFADPHLQALSSGQKMLLRIGPENARRVKAVLADVRRRLASGDARPGAAAPAPSVPASAAQ
ncbi:DUF3014 domain-containing protein [Acidovorax sp. NCPPB 4044]|uniref:DUF3014 domain-containing protein n=1 Tax=Acidovorax sp. NCPPB 4044 TaxID=2940490 RepID=UPI002303B51B|nr:DUF3014 domain-containing protein [Acidovorax sp. NCPPB 4044]MDA8521387.1 DUF3014 domain-containing protein [Acidovorax sp. NCPPB 4044]